MSSRLLQFTAVVTLVMAAGVAQACPGAAMKSTDGAKASNTASSSSSSFSSTVKARRG
ncbi:MAG: hypothetical protein H7125_01230 [Proteobacteria bacterium]|nr:hypothetical protein [Burkholderiales bacterium]